ncbi:MAG: hypothetical protein JWO19_3699 [Bryobacterales bacterium]|nr:hypothetical protein [Bryobacterales bacterium]
MRDSRLVLAIGLLAALATLAGCAGRTRYPTYYILNVPPPLSGRSQPILGSVAVREFSAPAFLNGGPIVYRQSPEQLDFYAYHHWAEDPRRAATSAMMRAMQARGLFRSVDVFDGRGSPECLLTGTLHRLEEVDQGTNVSIVVTLSARLVDLRTGEVIWQDMSSKTSKLDQRSVSGIVAEMSRDLASAIEDLVSSMRNRVLEASLPLGRSNAEQ